MPSTGTIPTERTFVDDHGVTIVYYVWEAERPRAVLQLAHGLGEHANRYAGVIAQLTAAGITVYADDHRGHGKTGMLQHNNDSTLLGRLGPGGVRAAIEGLHRLTKIIKADHPSLPVVYLGHSWGSVMGQVLINRHASDFDAVVLTGTAYRVLPHIKFANFNAKYGTLGTTGYEWLSRDAAIAKAFVEDPLTFYADSRKLFGIVDGMRLLGRPAKLARDVPMLIMIGGDDPVGGERSVQKLANSYIRRGGLTDVEVVVYSDARHEIFNELNKQDVADDLLAWLNKHLPA